MGMYTDDDEVEYFGKRKETFEIYDDEQLIGCKLDHDGDYFWGVSWLKMKVS